MGKHLNSQVTKEKRKLDPSDENLLNLPQQRHEKEN